MTKLSESAEVCKENGKRLLEDAEQLHDLERYPSAFGLAKLAQEEFAKGFILKLVDNGALKWSPEVKRSLNHHVSKQLMTLILEFLNPDIEDFFKLVQETRSLQRPKKVSDAINIYVHEILRRWEANNWDWAEDPEYDREAKFIFDGNEDKLKQNAFYVLISKDGKAINNTKNFSQEQVKTEIEKAYRYSNIKSDFRFNEIVEIIKLIKD